MLEQDDAIGYVFLQAMTREGTITPLGSYDRRYALILEPLEKSSKFGPKNRLIGKTRKQIFNGIEHDPLGTNAVDGVPQADEKPFQVIFAGFFNFASIDVHIIE